MNKRVVRKDEQIKLIMECRQSGYVIPVSESKSNATAVSQEVVKMDLIPQTDISRPSIE